MPIEAILNKWTREELKLWWTLMVLTGGEGGPQQQGEGAAVQQESTGSKELRQFHNALQEARDQLREIETNYEQVQGEDLYRHRRNSIDDLLASFAQAGDKQQDKRQLQQLASDWLMGDFEAEPAAAAAGPGSPLYETPFDQTEVGKVKKKYKDMSEEEDLPVKVPPEQPQFEDLHGAATELDIKLRHMQQRLHNQELLEQRDSKKEPSEPKESEENSSLQSYGNAAVPDGVYERTLQRMRPSSNGNNLAHEANYKLSKIEQDAAEQAAKARYPNGPMKRSSSAGGFNPMNEIKLKTSNHLMRKGMGPSLPSNAFTDSLRSHYVESRIAQREQELKQEQEQEGEEAAVEPFLLPYETLAESMPSQLAAEEHLLDVPQSYDYRLPNFEHHPLARHRQSLPNLREKAERFKRQPDSTAPEGAQSKAQEAPASASENPLPEAEELLARLSGPDTSGAQLKEPAANEAAEAKAGQAAVQEQQPAKQQELQVARPLNGHPDAVIKLLANKMSQHANDKDRDKRNAKRWAWQRVRRLKQSHSKRRSKRSLEEKESEPGDDMPQLKEEGNPDVEEAELEAGPSSRLDAFEDHNGNRLHYGNLGNDLRLDPDEAAAEDSSDGGEGVANLREDEAAMDLGSTDTNIFSSSRYQVPMMNQRPYLPQRQQQLQPAYLQQYQPMPPLQQFQQQQQLQQFPQQQQQQQPPLKCNVNFTHLFNELAKLQRMPHQQQHQQHLQHQHQPQQHQLAQYQQPPQQPNPDINQMRPFYGIRRAFGPHFGKAANQLRFQEDLCGATAQTTTAAAATDPATAAPTTDAPATAPPATAPPATAPPPTAPPPTAPPATAPPCTPPPATSPPAAAATPARPCSTLSPDCVPVSSETPATATTARTAAPSEAGEGNGLCNRAESVKLNVSLNANVCADPRTNQFIGNGSISVQPSGGGGGGSGYADYVDERYSREAREHSEEAKERMEQRKNGTRTGSRRQLKAKAKTSSKASNSTSSGERRHRLEPNDPHSEKYSKLISGKLSDEIVHAVLDMVSNDPSLDVLAAVLAKNRKCSTKSAKYFYQIRNDASEKKLQQAENLVRQTMETLSDLIDKQMQARNCIPLRPDLAEFYNLIMTTMAEQQKTREKREASLRLLADDFDPEQRKFLQPERIEQKSRIVKKLLGQYDALPAEQQHQLASVRDELLMDLIYLRKMSETLERNQRNALLSGLMRHEESEAGHGNGDYSPRFLKLLKTAEIFKEVGEQQARAFIGI